LLPWPHTALLVARYERLTCSDPVAALFLALHVFMEEPRRHELPRQRVGTRFQRRDEELVRLAQAAEKRDHQVILADRSADRVELFRPRLELVDVREHIITFFHHGREETSTKKELVGKALLLEVFFQS